MIILLWKSEWFLFQFVSASYIIMFVYPLHVLIVMQHCMNECNLLFIYNGKKLLNYTSKKCGIGLISTT